MSFRFVVLLAAGAVFFGCSSTETDDDSEANAGAGNEPAPLFAESSCATCLEGGCEAELGDCSADSSCSAYWNCLGACEVSESGSADSSCEASCERAAEASDARTALSTCLWSGAGASCSACGASGPSGTGGVLDQMCGASEETDACYKCEDEHCCDTYAACHTDSECQAFLTCLQACPSATFSSCRDDCVDMHPEGIDTWAPRFACIMVECSHGGDCLDTPASSCEECTNAECAESYVACEADPTCFRLWNCAESCTTPDCLDACEAEYPDAAEAFDAFFVCATHRCLAECG